MNRKEAIKSLGFSAIGAGFLLEACKTDTESTSVVHKDNLEDVAGRQDFEIERLKKIKEQGPFFDKHEMLTITALVDIIIPKDEVSGSASDAKVPEFIDFIVKDIPKHQVPMRGGLRWLDMECMNRYKNSFIECTLKEQLEIIEEIAYPSKVKPEMQQGMAFFNRIRNLTASGFYTTPMGIRDIGYVGNTPTKWEGVPQDVMAQYDVEGF